MKTEKTLLSAAVLTACIGFAGSASAALLMVSFDQQSVFLFDENTPGPGAGLFGVHNSINDRVEGYESVWWRLKNDADGNQLPRGTASDATPIGTVNPLIPTEPPVTVGDVDQGKVSALKVVGEMGLLEVPEDGSLSLAVTLSTIYHRNNRIPRTNTPTPSSGFIDSSTLFSYSGVSVNDKTTLPFTFFETPNSGDCQPIGNPNETICDDVFRFPLLSFAPVPITIGGVAFEFLFDLKPGAAAITNLKECRENIAACLIIDGVPFITVWTGEDTTNFLQVTVQARLAPEREVPTPGTLSLLGLGLVGLSAALRRRRTAVR